MIADDPIRVDTDRLSDIESPHPLATLPGHTNSRSHCMIASPPEPSPASNRLRRRCASAVLVVAAVIGMIVIGPLPRPDVASAASTPTKFVSVDPFRLVDTRIGVGTEQLDAHTRRVQVAGVAGVPADATAVSVSMVATGAVSTGFLLTYPTGEQRPDSSNLNYQAGRTYSTGAVIPLGANGQFDVYIDNPVEYVIDVTGAFVPSGPTTDGRFVPLDDSLRVHDTRSSGGAPLAAGEVASVTLPDTVPTDATAAMVTLTSGAPNDAGYFTAYTRDPLPYVSALNVSSPNSTRATTAILPVSSRTMRVFSSNGGHLIVDVIGYFTGNTAPRSSDGLFVPMIPTRRFDTRTAGVLHAGQARSFQAPGGGVAVGSLAMIRPQGPGWAAAWANGTSQPATSSINLSDANVIANLAVTRVTDHGAAVYSSTTAHYLFDQFGYFTTPLAAVTQPLVTDAPLPPPAAAPAPRSGCTVSGLLVPSCGIWFGASTPSRSNGYDYERGLTEYEAVAQNTPDILHFYKSGPVKFPTASEVAMTRRPSTQRSLLLYNWKPSSKYTWRQVADGAADAEIATIAAGIKAFPNKLFLNIYHEPEDNVKPAAGSGMTAVDYAAMYRHVVTELRGAGVGNAVFVWNLMGFSGWRKYMDDLYPGDAYVDWMAFDPYMRDDTFSGLIDLVDRNRTDIGWPGLYSWATAKAPGKPIMFAEWGVDVSSNSDPVSKIRVDGADLARRFPMLKAIVYWNEVGVGDYRIDSSRGYGDAFRQLAAQPTFNATSPDIAP